MECSVLLLLHCCLSRLMKLATGCVLNMIGQVDIHSLIGVFLSSCFFFVKKVNNCKKLFNLPIYSHLQFEEFVFRKK